MTRVAVTRNTPWPIIAVTRAVQCLTAMTRSYLEPHGYVFLDRRALPRATAGFALPDLAIHTLPAQRHG